MAYRLGLRLPGGLRALGEINHFPSGQVKKADGGWFGRLSEVPRLKCDVLTGGGPGRRARGVLHQLLLWTATQLEEIEPGQDLLHFHERLLLETPADGDIDAGDHRVAVGRPVVAVDPTGYLGPGLAAQIHNGGQGELGARVPIRLRDRQDELARAGAPSEANRCKSYFDTGIRR